MPFVIGEQELFPASADNAESLLTNEWLEAASGAVNIVGSMGSQFNMTKDDMLGNIKKVRTKYETDMERFEFVKAMLEDEQGKKEDKNDKSATVGGLWLKRGLEYLCEVFCELIREHEASKLPGGRSDSGAVKAACKAAYEKTLTKYHNMAARILVKGGLMVSPYKETLMANLAKGEKDKADEVVNEMTAYERPLRAYVILLCQLYNSLGYKDECIACST